MVMLPKVAIAIPVPPTSLSQSPPVRRLKRSNPYSKPDEFAKASGPATERQAWFRDQLNRLAVALGSPSIPFAFEDKSGDAYVLDRGAVKFAVNSGFIRPLEADATGLVREVVLARTPG